MISETLIQLAPDFFIHPDFVEPLRHFRIKNLDSVFAFEGGISLTKKELTHWRSRIELSLPEINVRCFIKRYDHPPAAVQIRNWFNHRKREFTALYDVSPCSVLYRTGVGTYRVIAYGGRWNGLFEEKSFAILLEIQNAQSLEKQLPECFTQTDNPAVRKARAAFIHRLADFVRKFHHSGYCHRDLYLCHIFRDMSDNLFLIDLQRAFQPLFCRRWIRKDLTQLYYSSPGDIISRTERLRFYLRYIQKDKLTDFDRTQIRKIKRKAWHIADRAIRRGNDVPFAR
jgi:serine/threonine protein kinase